MVCAREEHAPLLPKRKLDRLAVFGKRGRRTPTHWRRSFTSLCTNRIPRLSPPSPAMPSPPQTDRPLPFISLHRELLCQCATESRTRRRSEKRVDFEIELITQIVLHFCGMTECRHRRPCLSVRLTEREEVSAPPQSQLKIGNLRVTAAAGRIFLPFQPKLCAVCMSKTESPSLVVAKSPKLG